MPCQWINEGRVIYSAPSKSKLFEQANQFEVPSLEKPIYLLVTNSKHHTARGQREHPYLRC